MVRPGDKVTRGQVLGQLGQSGNSTAPHLHFHVMNRPSKTRLGANGVPDVFGGFLSSEMGDVSILEEYASIPCA
jgi:murein DD-endopeptidase MepM/ murein hydrolase activator NlpD